ncbi:T9SS type A sorting domain-containing protein [Epilithonimonas zeae]|uniref:T9SS type A sorting domain-containing protein n=1 Tax=Epilithonimonas zeae TaxID=1416779 RepID=UPI00200F1A88|nr:T9SS type A sorting domain-containing protein [Epilithonimonas zeae]UQB70183.1 T9SS type A sorting domain-containing protein [Epilithonimonas zeae]
MKKLLLSFIATSAIFFSANAQTKISFEASEGYNVGSVDGQKDWTASSSYFKVSNNRATDGTSSLYIEDDASEEWSNAYTTIPNYSKTEVSADVYLDGFDSDYAVGLYTEDGDVVADFWLTYQSWNFVVYDPAQETYVETDLEWDSTTWYNFKTVIDKANNTLEYYVNGNVIYSTTLTATDFSFLDLSIENYGSGFSVDNIQVKDATLAVAEAGKKDIFRVYPNPTVDVVNFDVAGKINSVEVYDVAGKLVKMSKDGAKSLNVSELGKGNYVVKVQTENASYTKKVIKK